MKNMYAFKKLHCKLTVLSVFILIAGVKGIAQPNPSTNEATLVTTDIVNFWKAYDQSLPNYDPSVFQKLYIDQGSKGLKGFMKNRIQSAEHLSKVIKSHKAYFHSIRESTDRISSMKPQIQEIFNEFQKLYPSAKFPPVYFVIGAMNSGGTTSKKGLIIGAEMYGITDETPMDELGNWHKTVLKPVELVPHIVAHELIHTQQKYRTNNLLEASIKEGAADFIAELISGEHINDHVHDFANAREEELWKEFKERMFQKDLKGWLYSSQEGRPNDLGYWMGYQISKSYYDHSPDKKQAIHDILNIKDFEAFLAESKYPEKFDKS